jgi:hypothetical protein
MFEPNAEPMGEPTGPKSHASPPPHRRSWGHRLLRLALGGAALGLGLFVLAARAGDRTKYRATALLLANRNAPTILPGDAGAKESEQDFKLFLHTQADLIRSHLVLGAALRDEKLAKLPTVAEQADPIGWLEERLNVEFARDSEVFKVSLEGDRPDDLKAIVDAVVESYLHHVVDRDRDERQARYDKLKKLWHTYQYELKRTRERLRQLNESAGTDNEEALAERRSWTRRELEECRRELRHVRRAKAAAEARLARSKDEKAGGDELAKTIPRLEGDIAALAAEESLLKEELQSLDKTLRHDLVVTLDLDEERNHMDVLEKTARLVGAEIEKVDVEMQAPPRVQRLGKTTVPQRR